jgi:hypothetical protein
MAFDFLKETTYTNDSLANGDFTQMLEQMLLAKDTEPGEGLIDGASEEEEIDDGQTEVIQNEEEQEQEEESPIVEEDEEIDPELMDYLFSDTLSKETSNNFRNSVNLPENNSGISWLKTKTKNVNLKGLDASISKYLESLPDNLRTALIATSGNDDNHTKNSKHYSNDAIDLRFNQDAYDYMMSDPSFKHSGLKLLSPNHGTAKHLHIEKMQMGGKRKNSDSDLGPINFLNSYFKSDEFKSKYLAMNGNNNLKYDEQMRNHDYQANRHNPGRAGAPYAQGSVAFKHYLDAYNAGVPELSMLLDPFQAKDIKANLLTEVLPHEYAHNIRDLELPEEKLFANGERNPKMRKVWENFIKNKSSRSTTFSDFLQKVSGDNHDFQPDEQYSDLSSLRYLLYRNDIYDVRKGKMTKEQLEKAKNTPAIRDSFMFKRLQDHFNDEQIINLNNKVAKNDSNSLDSAQYGGKTLYADSEQIQRIGLNNPNFNQALFPLKGINTFRGLDSKQPVMVTDGSKYKILVGKQDTAKFKGNVYETKI